MSGFWRAFDRYWFAPSSSQTLALVRIFVSLSAVMKLVGVYGVGSRMLMGIFSMGLPRHRYRAKTYSLEVYPDPWIDGMPVPDFATFQLLETLTLAAAALATLGLLSRASTLTTALLLFTITAVDELGFKHNAFALACALLLLSLSPCGDHYSLDAVVRRGLRRLRGLAPTTPPLRSVVWLKLHQVHLAAIYLFSTLAKLNADWFGGHLFHFVPPDQKPIDTFYGPALVAWWASVRWPGALIGSTTVIIEGALVALPFVRSATARQALLFLGVALHIGIDASLDVGTYTWTILACYIAFTDPATRQTELRYDPSVARHRRIARVVGLLDWLLRLRRVPVPGIGQIAAVDAAGVVSTGSDARDAVLARLPLTFFVPLALRLWGVVGRWRGRRYTAGGDAHHAPPRDAP